LPIFRIFARRFSQISCENPKEAQAGDETMMDTSIDSNAGGDLPNKKIDVTDAQDSGVAPRNRE
jgi:hypothetical protein